MSETIPGSYENITVTTEPEHAVQALLSSAICTACGLGSISADAVVEIAQQKIIDSHLPLEHVDKSRLKIEASMLLRFLFDKPTKDLFIKLGESVEKIINAQPTSFH